MNARLQGQNLSMTFGDVFRKVEAVKQVDISLNPGETIGIVGESGSGKSTLARVLAGIQRPTSGEVFYEGENIWRGKVSYPGSLRQKVQMVFQDPYGSLNPRMRAVNAVAEAVRFHQKVDAESARSIALDLLDRMGIANNDAVKLPRALSGGQRQRVSVARALSANPDVLIADEPTSAIDQSAQSQLLSLFGELIQGGLSIILVSHDLGVIRYLTDRVYVMESGRFVEEGLTAQIFENPTVEYTQKLIASIPGRMKLAQRSTPSL
jgi:peptide/nickel transport system ATP-binding protein